MDIAPVGGFVFRGREQVDADALAGLQRRDGMQGGPAMRASDRDEEARFNQHTLPTDHVFRREAGRICMAEMSAELIHDPL